MSPGRVQGGDGAARPVRMEQEESVLRLGGQRAERTWSPGGQRRGQGPEEGGLQVRGGVHVRPEAGPSDPTGHHVRAG